MPVKRSVIAICLFLLSGMLFAQAPADSVKRGTIQVRKVKSDRIKSVKAVRRYSYRFRMNGNDYKTTFPKSYKADLYPLVFNNSDIVITDGNKNITDNKVQAFVFDLFIGNIFVWRESRYQWYQFNQMVSAIHSPGSFVWILHLSFTDKNGVLHTDEIPDFKIERIN